MALRALSVLGLALLVVTWTACGDRRSRPAAAPPPDDHGDSAAAATAFASPPPPSPPPNPVAAWVMQDGVLAAPGDVDWFAVDLRGGVLYTFATSVDASMDTVLRLVDRDGTTQLAENDDIAPPGPTPGSAADRGSVITTSVPVDGLYYLEVRHHDATGTGSYRLLGAQGAFTSL